MKLKFLTCSLLFAVTGMGITFNNAQAQEQIRTKEIGLQLYSVRSMIGSHVQPDTYNADYFSVLQKLAKMGYTSVESAGYKDGMFYNTTPQVFKKNVEKAGMKVLSSHASRTLTQEELASGDFSKALIWWKETIIAHKAAGIK